MHEHRGTATGWPVQADLDGNGGRLVPTCGTSREEPDNRPRLRDPTAAAGKAGGPTTATATATDSTEGEEGLASDRRDAIGTQNISVPIFPY